MKNALSGREQLDRVVFCGLSKRCDGPQKEKGGRNESAREARKRSDKTPDARSVENSREVCGWVVTRFRLTVCPCGLLFLSNASDERAKVSFRC